ncbi:hypothetical protein DYBT9623_00244 [Dyadobacter sp. CECT 9623]|uniref:Transposase n=1 Tax=Dyadobacter linearis TaxID=2823330 RepID=A0ABM8UJG4_9BACT|nr:hypothetical protein DYBT9623_00244 [Dyadobacter sp. CECT 9623]
MLIAGYPTANQPICRLFRHWATKNEKGAFARKSVYRLRQAIYVA